MSARIVLSVVFASFLLMAGGLSACNTTEGFGEDMQNAGEKIEKKAEDSK